MKAGVAYRRDAGLLAIAIGLILAGYFAPFLFGGASLMQSPRVPSLYRGGTVAGLPARGTQEVDDASAFITEPWIALHHRLLFEELRPPLWDPYDGYGAPFAAAMQPQPFYPPTALLALHPSPRAFAWWVVVRLFICGWFAALFVRLFADRWSALAAGCACALTGYFQAYLTMPHISVETLLPMLLWATELLCRRVSPARFAALAAGGGLVQLGGMPEAAVLVVAVSAIYAVLRILAVEPQRWPALLAIAAAHVLGCGLGAIQLLPFLEYARASFNIHDTAGAGRPPIGLDFDYGWLRGIVLELVPRAFGNSQKSILSPNGGYTGLRGYIGCAAGFLGLVALFASVRARDARRWIVPFLVALSAYVLLKRFGNPLVNWTGDLPVLRLIYLAKYLEPILGISAGLAAGFGVAALRESRAAPWMIAGAYAAMLAVVSWLYLGTFEQIPPGPFAWQYPIAFGLALAVLAVLALAAWSSSRGSSPHRLAAVAIVAVVVLEPLVGYFGPVYWSDRASVSENPYSGAPYIAYLRAAVQRTRERVIAVDALEPNWAGAFALDDPRSLNALYPDGYLQFVDAFLRTGGGANAVNGYDRFASIEPRELAGALGRRWMQLSSIGYLVTARPSPFDDLPRRPLYGTVFEEPAVKVLRVPDALPRLALFHEARPAATRESALTMLTSPAFDITRAVVVEGSPPHVAPRAGIEQVVTRSVRSDAVEADVTTTSDAVLMQNDTWFPGWVARINGVQQPILRVDGLFRGIAVPAGRHRVRISYEPVSFALGAGVSAAAVAVVAVLVAIAWRNARRRPAA